MGGPWLSGASQLAWTLVLDSAVTVGANGVSGASVLSSVTLIVTLTASLPPLPSLTLTATE